MDAVLNEYLEQVERYLKPMAVSERVDIVKEIKSEMLELQGEGKTPQEILERLGDARELARAYLGESIAKGRGFSWRRLSAVIAFYSMAGAVGVCVLPVTSICAVAFLLSGAVCPLAGAGAGMAMGAQLVNQMFSSQSAAPQNQAASAPPCPNCGAVGAAGAKFCYNCGAPIPAPASATGDRFCPKCRKMTVGKFCSDCGTETV